MGNLAGTRTSGGGQESGRSRQADREDRGGCRVQSHPEDLREGALVGTLGTAATGVAAMAAKRYLDNKKARGALAEDAKAQLKAAV